MVNVDFSPALLLGMSLIAGGLALYQLRRVQPDISRDFDVIVSAVATFSGGILIFQVGYDNPVSPTRCASQHAWTLQKRGWQSSTLIGSQDGLPCNPGSWVCALVAGVAAGSSLAVLPAADSRHSAGLCCGVPEAPTGSARYPGKRSFDLLPPLIRGPCPLTHWALMTFYYGICCLKFEMLSCMRLTPLLRATSDVLTEPFLSGQ